MPKTFTLVLDKTNYLTLRALFKAASKDLTRAALLDVFYSHSRRVFVATDGHVCRFQGLEGEWYKDGIAPDFDFILKPGDFLITAAQWKQGGMFVKEITGRTEDADRYPNVWNVIAAGGGRLARVSLGADVIAQFAASFYPPVNNLVFVFTGREAGAINVFCAGRYVGIVMPLRILVDLAVEEVARLSNPLVAAHAAAAE